MARLEGDLPRRSSGLLVPGDPNPVAVENLSGSSPFLLLGDHAGRAIPAKLEGLGLISSDLDRHIAWDIGVAGLGADLATRLDAAFIHQRYSRLVIDCNRAPADESSVPTTSDETIIPANLALSPAQLQERRAEIFDPYHAQIDALIRVRRDRGQATTLVSVHSFTPRLQQQPRPWRFGVLHRGDSPFSSAVLKGLRDRFQVAVGDNAPYAMDGTDYTVPHHADSHHLDYLELEVRQDVLLDPSAQRDIGQIVSEVLTEALG